MLKQQRHQKILEILETESYASAVTLASKLFVSLPTVRRDLAELQKQNLVVRSHGGAAKVDDDRTVLPLDMRKTRCRAEKRRLCASAATLVNDGDIIFLDASSTVLQMADFLSSKKSLTVVTNGIALAALTCNKGIKTYCIGGEMQENSSGTAGTLAREFIENFNIDIMFFSSTGINASGIITDTSLPETMLRKAVMKRSAQTAFLCDSSKIFAEAPYNLAPLENVSKVITDSVLLAESGFVNEKNLLLI